MRNDRVIPAGQWDDEGYMDPDVLMIVIIMMNRNAKWPSDSRRPVRWWRVWTLTCWPRWWLQMPPELLPRWRRWVLRWWATCPRCVSVPPVCSRIPVPMFCWYLWGCELAAQRDANTQVDCGFAHVWLFMRLRMWLHKWIPTLNQSVPLPVCCVYAFVHGWLNWCNFVLQIV